MKEMYIVLCDSHTEDDCGVYRVGDETGKNVFDSIEEAQKVVDEDMKEYLKSEQDEFGEDKVRIEGFHIVWDGDNEYTRYAKWHIWRV